MRYRFVAPRSGRNKKLGGIPAVYAGEESCPASCPLNGKGCYAQTHHWIRKFWKELPLKLTELAIEIWKLPAGSLWRYGVAGDLPGRGEEIHERALKILVRANRGKRGFAFTHKPPTLRNQKLIQFANQNGFTINWSAEGLERADLLASLNVAPVSAIVPSDTPAKGAVTPRGRPVVVCPAQWKDGVTCASCGACAVAHRDTIIGFWPHGVQKRVVEKELFG